MLDTYASISFHMSGCVCLLPKIDAFAIGLHCVRGLRWLVFKNCETSVNVKKSKMELGDDLLIDEELLLWSILLF